MEGAYLIRSVAKEIIQSLSTVIFHPIFVTDLEGVILASTNETLESSHYFPAVDAIANKEMVVNESTFFSIGHQKHCGCVVPVEVNQHVAGTVGILGDPNETLKFMGLLKKYAELLALGHEERKGVVSRQKKVGDLVKAISNYDPDQDEDILLCSQAMEMGFNLESDYVSMIVELKHEDGSAKQEQLDLVFEMIKLEFLNPLNMMSQLTGDKFFLFVNDTYQQGEANHIQETKLKADKLTRKLEQRGWSVYVGIGSTGSSISELHHIYYEAWIALTLAKKFEKKKRIAFIGDYLLEEILLSANKKCCEAYLDKTVNKIKTIDEDDVLFNTVKVWCESGFRKNETSKKLNIHRNTLDYRLRRIEDASGVCVDKYKEILRLYLGILIDGVFST